jgi:hypothetical protein
MSDNEPALALVAEGPEYELFAAADSSAFKLVFKTDNMVANILGDDAVRFRADYESIKEQYPTYQPDQMLAQLWDQGGYSWLAAPPEEA